MLIVKHKWIWNVFYSLGIVLVSYNETFFLAKLESIELKYDMYSVKYLKLRNKW